MAVTLRLSAHEVGVLDLLILDTYLVCYDGTFAPDDAELAHTLTAAQAIQSRLPDGPPYQEEAVLVADELAELYEILRDMIDHPCEEPLPMGHADAYVAYRLYQRVTQALGRDELDLDQMVAGRELPLAGARGEARYQRLYQALCDRYQELTGTSPRLTWHGPEIGFRAVGSDAGAVCSFAATRLAALRRLLDEWTLEGYSAAELARAVA